MNITIRFIYRAIKWCCENSTIGGSSSARLPKAIMDTRVDQSSARTHMEKSSAQAEKMSRELNISTRTMSRIIRDDVHMKAYRRSAGHRLDARLKNQA